MVVNDVTPVWSNLGQTHPRGGRVPGARMTYCPSDAFEESCQDPNNPYGGSSEELFGMDNVMFPGVVRGDYASNPLSDFGTVRIPDTESMGTVRIPDTESMGYFGDSPMAQWSSFIAAAALLGGAYFLKGNLKNLANGMGVVAGGMAIVGFANRVLA